MTAVLAVFKTVATKVCVAPPYTEAVGGFTVTETGGERLTVAAADLVVSAVLVAVTVTVCADVIVFGAVYTPEALMEPLEGLMVQVIPVLFAFETVALKVCVPPP